MYNLAPILQFFLVWRKNVVYMNKQHKNLYYVRNNIIYKLKSLFIEKNIVDTGDI